MASYHLHAIQGGSKDRVRPTERVDLMRAARQFLGELIETDFGGGVVQFRHIARSYGILRDEFGWPSISEKNLSQILCALGCERIVIDRRSAGKGRFTYLEIPVSLEAPVELELRRAA